MEVISTETVHEPSDPPDAAGTVPSVKVKEAPSATALRGPPQLLTTFSGVAIRIPGGKVSV